MAEVEIKPHDDITTKHVLENPVKISRTDDEDTLVNVHVNNPLKKITKLLEDIKKQKAFSFSIKGSLGIAGIALVITTFGIFGGTRAFCSRGDQTFIGTLYPLQVEDTVTTDVPLLDQIRDMLWNEKPAVTKRLILIRPDSTILTIKQVSVTEAKKYLKQRVLITGEYDACMESIKVHNPFALELSAR